MQPVSPGFRKVHVEPGETKTVTMVLRPYDLLLLDGNLKRVVEPGEFQVMVGQSCEKMRLCGKLTVTP